MSVKTGTVVLKWADGEYPFRLAKRELQELSRKIIRLLMVEHGVSEAIAVPLAFPWEIYRRVTSGNPIAGEVYEVIFQGLVGADMKPQEAVALCKRYVDERPLLEYVPLAHAIMLEALVPPVGTTAKKKPASEAAKANTNSVGSDSPKTAPPSDSVPAT